MSAATVTRISSDWLGVLPGTWLRFPFQVVFSERKEPSTHTDAHLTPSQKFGVMPQADYIELTGNRVVLNLTGSDNMRHVEPGDFISHLRSFQGGLEHSALSGKVSAAYTVIAPQREIVPDYFRHLFKSAAFIQALQSTTDQLRDGQSIRFSELKLIDLPCPPVGVQRSIADFLDRETAEIDAFVAESEKLITLLNERRAAVITQAVTKGLDPTAPMKDTGIEWLGQIPAHWAVSKVNLWYEVVLGKMLDEAKFSGTVGELQPYVRAANITEKNLSFDQVNEMPFTAAEAGKFDLRQGDLLVVEGGSVGQNVVLSDDMPGWGFQKTVNRVRPRTPGASTVFLGYALDMLRYRGVVDMVSAGSTIAHLTAEKLGRLTLGLPPREEQSRICAYVGSQTAKIDEAIETAGEAITLAKERRQALISAAVTGKIDVRAAA